MGSDAFDPPRPRNLDGAFDRPLCFQQGQP